MSKIVQRNCFSILSLHLLVAHCVAGDVVADHVLRVPRFAVHAFNLDGELGKVEQREVAFEFFAQLRKATIRDTVERKKQFVRTVFQEYFF